MESNKPEIYKIEDISLGALGGELKNKIPEIDINPHQCDHSPEYLVFERTIHMDTYKVHIHRCNCCGEEVGKYDPFTENDMA